MCLLQCCGAERKIRQKKVRKKKERGPEREFLFVRQRQREKEYV